jgi:hypothetical protein
LLPLNRDKRFEVFLVSILIILIITTAEEAWFEQFELYV